MKRLGRILGAALAFLLALSPAMSLAEEADLEVTARLFRVKTAPFEKGLSDEKRCPLGTVFDQKGVATLEALLKEAGGQCLASASAEEAETMALTDLRREKYVRDVDVDIDGGEPIPGELSWGLSLTASGVERDDAGNLRMTLKVTACVLRPERRREKTGQGNIDLPGLAALGGTVPLSIPPAGAVVLGGSDLEEPAYSVALVIGTKGQKPPDPAAEVTGPRGLMLRWLDLPGKDAEGILEAAPKPPSISRELAVRARKAKVRLWAFAPACESPLDLIVSSQQPYVRDYDEQSGAGITAWDPVVESLAESIHLRWDGATLKLDANLVERPIAEKKAADGKKRVLDPAPLSVAVESALSEEEGELDWLLTVPNKPGGALLVSSRRVDR